MNGIHLKTDNAVLVQICSQHRRVVGVVAAYLEFATGYPELVVIASTSEIFFPPHNAKTPSALPQSYTTNRTGTLTEADNLHAIIVVFIHYIFADFISTE